MQSDIGKTEWTRVARPWIPTVLLVGRRASDPEPRYMPSGGPVAQLRLATNEGEEPQFHQLSRLEEAGRVCRQLPQEGPPALRRGQAAWSSAATSDHGLGSPV